VAEDGGKLRVDLRALWRVGSVDLPELAALCHEVAQLVTPTDSTLSTALWRSPYFGGDSQGPVSRPLYEALNELGGFVAETSTALSLAGEACCLAARRYAEADGHAAAWLGGSSGPDPA
jgi:hypothetical protein